MQLSDKKVESYMDIANVMAMRSTCYRLGVGACIFDMKSDRALSTGYNGTASGMPHCKDMFIMVASLYYVHSKVYEMLNMQPDTDLIDTDKYKVPYERFIELHHKFSTLYEIHAEQNAIYSLIRTGVNTTGMDLACCSLIEPCEQCTKALIGVGVKHIFYRYPYDRSNNTIYKVCEEAGVECRQL